MAGQGKLIQSLVTSNFWATGLGSPTPNKTLGSTSLSCSSVQLYLYVYVATHGTRVPLGPDPAAAVTLPPAACSPRLQPCCVITKASIPGVTRIGFHPKP
jgi:hypothetical protein